MNSVKISDKVLRWYDIHQRTLPWRYTTGQIADPYHVWLSEMMLQQTQVYTVIPYFQKFTEKWPTVQQLAAADLDEVLHLWQGLGYYARARNLHKCAQKIVEHFDGEFPKTPLELATLPGIGPYASAAIAAIAFKYPATVVDGNVARIVSRVFGFGAPIKKNQKQIYTSAESVTPSLRAGDYAQALMDIGSGICTPRSPKCGQCPLNKDCKAYASGAPELFPGRLDKASIPTRFAVAFVCLNDGHILLRKRSAEKMLGGLWELPGSDWYTDSLPELPDDIGIAYKDVKHTFSHFHLITRVANVASVEPEHLNGEEVSWAISALDQLALSTLTKKLLKSKQ
jgi:A/G-specific adenine glycosylase